ncbi:hypothetical protein OY671_010471, partial [Metschnikowia pulcherrima]
MAEASINHDLGPHIRAISAGTNPGPKVADGAITALQQLEIETTGLHPKTIDAVMDESIDSVVT